MAQAIYKEWFVNFRFPGHETAKMVNSELKKMPVGWRIATFKDIVDFIKEGTKPGEHLINRFYVPIDCLSRKSLTLLESKSWEEAKSSLLLFNKGDILFGAMRPYFHKVVIAPFDGVTRTTCFILRAKSSEYFGYSVMLAFQEDTVGFANAHCKGATIPYAVWDGSLADMKIVLPPKHILINFNKYISPILNFLQTSYLKLNNLRNTRNLLLPKLISGEIDVERLETKTDHPK
ncbi:MAG: restriction endonuclease subunit S [Thermodesulfobacteriota bacterium]